MNELDTPESSTILKMRIVFYRTPINILCYVKQLRTTNKMIFKGNIGMKYDEISF